MEKLYVVKYTGPFGFIKPWTAVRDSETFSQQFLTPSMLEGIEKKLFPELLYYPGALQKIIRYRLNYEGIGIQKERTWPKRGGEGNPQKNFHEKMSTIDRGILINPHLYLAFHTIADAHQASSQHICLSRNEDLLYPEAELQELTEEEFNQINGFELIFHEIETPSSFKVGHNRFNGGREMFGELSIIGNPIRTQV